MAMAQQPSASGGSADSKAAELLARLDRLPMSRWHVVFYVIVVLSWLGDNTDQSLQGAINNRLVAEWHVTLVQVGLIGSFTGIGNLIGSFGFGWLSDRFGRRRAFMGAICMFSILTAAGALTQDINQLLVVRALTGLGIGGIAPCALPYIAEYAPSAWRNRFLAWARFAVSLSSFTASLVGIAVTIPYGWRMGYLAGLVPVLFALVGFAGLIPESARYLIQKGRLAEAEQTVDRVERAVLGRNYVPPSRPTGTGLGATGASGLTRESSSMIVAIKTIMRPGNRAAALLVIPMWVLPYSFGTGTIDPVLLPGRIGITLAVLLAATASTALLGPVGNVLSGFISDLIGRKRTIYLAVLVPSLAVWAQWNLAHDFTSLVICMGLNKLFGEIYIAAVYIYTADQFPVTIRSMGVGASFGVFRITQIFSPLIATAIVMLTGDVTLLLYLNLLAFGSTSALVWLFGRETGTPRWGAPSQSGAAPHPSAEKAEA